MTNFLLWHLDALEAIADGLETYPQRVSISYVTGVEGDEIDTTTAQAAKFIQAFVEHWKYSSANRLTHRKAAELAIQHDMCLSGFVLCDERGNRYIIEMSAVRVLTREEMWKLMHPAEPAK